VSLLTAATKLWVSHTNVDGLDVTVGLARIKAGSQIYIQDFDDSTKWLLFNVTADGINKGVYHEFAIAFAAGPGNIPTQKVALQSILHTNPSDVVTDSVAGTTTTVTHNFNTRDVTALAYRNTTPWETVPITVARPTVNTVDVTFGSSATAGQYRIIVRGVAH
jgi:hypothetical protein